MYQVLGLNYNTNNTTHKLWRDFSTYMHTYNNRNNNCKHFYRGEFIFKKVSQG